MSFSNEEMVIFTLEHIEATQEFPEDANRIMKLQIVAEGLVSVYDDVVIVNDKGQKYLIDRLQESLELQDLAVDSDYKALYMEDESWYSGDNGDE